MGRTVKRLARSRGHQVSAIFHDESRLTPESDLGGSEVLVDFSLGNAVLDVLHTAALRGVPVVEGTTGWYDELEQARQISGLTMVYSPNFSVGVYQFQKLVEIAAGLMGGLGGYDVYVHEWHHAGKSDSPSGTAKSLANSLIARFAGKEGWLGEACHQPIEASELHVTSTRAGRFPGTHEVGFDSESDSVTLRHVAHGREGFALGAILAAEWIVGKSGIHSMDDFLADLGIGGPAFR